ncbi:hypothetical protein [Trinickia terrae]|uniref:hypothetical protein n=1 Tax=Trinickia terrae TaxID=2571161 RepID=UPI001F0FF4C4|nr:hypothetical protein [Trinickia terrae]
MSVGIVISVLFDAVQSIAYAQGVTAASANGSKHRCNTRASPPNILRFSLNKRIACLIRLM